MMRTAWIISGVFSGFMAGLIAWTIGGELERSAAAVKPGACMDELERVRTDLRLRAGELAVCRAQLRRCEKREATP